MPILHTHWLWFFGAVALGVVLGWLTHHRETPRWPVRPIHIAMAVVILVLLLAVARVVPNRYGSRLELGVIVAACCGVGWFIGRAMRDLADYMPAGARPGAAATSGSYLFREAHAGLGTGSAYMRSTATDAVLPRERLPMVTGPLTRAPMPGGYTFPATLPFADATTSRAATPVAGRRGHWSWPRPAGAAPYVPAEPPVAKGGYVFPVAARASSHACAPREGVTRGGQYKHWSWRAAGIADTAASSAPATKPMAPSPAGPIPSAADAASSAATARVAPIPPAVAELPHALAATTPEPDGAAAVSPMAAPAAPASTTSTSPAVSSPAPGIAKAADAPVAPDVAGSGAVPATPATPAAAPSGAAAGIATGVVDEGRTIQTSMSDPVPPAMPTVPGLPPAGGEAAALSDLDALPTSPAGLPTVPVVAPGQPAVIAAVPGEEKYPGARPEGLMSARGDRADDLKRIRGIGPQNEGRLHGLGVWHFDQIAAWTPENVRWVGAYLAFPGRIDRERWVEQAKALAGGDAAASPRPLEPR